MTLALLWLACAAGDADDSGAPADTLDDRLAACLGEAPTSWSGTHSFHAWSDGVDTARCTWTVESGAPAPCPDCALAFQATLTLAEGEAETCDPALADFETLYEGTVLGLADQGAAQGWTVGWVLDGVLRAAGPATAVTTADGGCDIQWAEQITDEYVDRDEQYGVVELR